ncbi:ParA family protein [Parabacteroides merdae]|jgi:chromosome partitioning protein|uniref:ParA family protein n=1 Tax=Parabacteroides merdae TaxID=46503 RepID=UPI0034A575C6
MENKIIAIANGKGGVAKTTTTFQLGWTLAKNGFKTLVIDCDAQCNLSHTFGMSDDTVYSENLFKSILNMTVPYAYTVHENLSVVIAHPDMCRLDKQIAGDNMAVMRLPRIITPLKEYFDFILLDCPPNLETTIVRGAIFAADFLLVPISGDYSLRGREDMLNMLEVINKDSKEVLNREGAKLLGYLMTRSYVKQIEWKKTLYDLRKNVNDNEIFSNIISERAHVRKCQAAHMPVDSYKKTIKGREVIDKSANDSIQEFEDVAQEFVERIHWLDAGHTFQDGLPDSLQERKYTFPSLKEVEELISKSAQHIQEQEQE